MKHVSKALFVVGLCVIFSVLGIDFSEHDAPAKALAILAVGYLVLAAGQAVQLSVEQDQTLPELEVF